MTRAISSGAVQRSKSAPGISARFSGVSTVPGSHDVGPHPLLRVLFGNGLSQGVKSGLGNRVRSVVATFVPDPAGRDKNQ